jgi:hypothetical protein
MLSSLSRCSKIDATVGTFLETTEGNSRTGRPPFGVVVGREGIEPSTY